MIIIIIIMIIIIIIIVVIMPVLSHSVLNLNGRKACRYARNLAFIFILTFKIKIGSIWHILAKIPSTSIQLR